jgi:aminoglycoside phosphotransferase (APT) family kinase protein
LVTGYRPGRVYADDLLRLRDQGEMGSPDIERAEALAAYLAGIHSVKHDEPILWRRRLRDLVGHGEGIMGLTDNYPPDLPWTSGAELRAIEEVANRWRWQLKPLTHRLSQVHGDFHPFNVLFDEGSEFVVLDRSRGEWGEPADDVSCMAINYLFFSLQRSGRLEDPLLQLHDRFWRRYLALQPDEELLTVIQPWFAWRALVLASPVWYPSLDEPVRRKLLNFAHRVMAAPQYDLEDVNQYLERS